MDVLSLENKVDKINGIVNGNLTVTGTISSGSISQNSNAITNAGDPFWKLESGAAVYTNGSVTIGHSNSSHQFIFEAASVDGQTNTMVMRPSADYTCSISDRVYLMRNYYISNLYAVTRTGLSDVRQKENLRKLVDVVGGDTEFLKLLDALSPVSFEWKADMGKTTYGFIAQECQRVVPQAVSGDEENEYYINYDVLLAYLWEAFLAAEKELEELEAAVSECEQV